MAKQGMNALGHIAIVTRVSKDYGSHHAVILSIFALQTTERTTILSQCDFALKFDAKLDQTIKVDLLASANVYVLCRGVAGC